MISFKDVNEKVRRKILYIHENAEPNIPVMGLFGLVGFPLFYIVWAYIFPQKFESLEFRLLIAVLSLPWLFYHYLPARLKSLFPVYLPLSIWVMIPFFFSFMLLKNDWSVVWTMSTMAGLFLMILLINDWRLITLLTVSAYLAACYAVWLIDGHIGFVYFQLEYIPIITFGIVGSIIFSHRKQIANQTKISLLHSLGGSIAHEMRNPLNTIINAMGSLQSILPEKPRQEKEERQYALSRSGLISLHSVLEENTETVLRANKIIDSILASMQGRSLQPTSFKKISAKNSIRNAVNTYSYKSRDERGLILVTTKKDFDFFGDKDLFVYVLFNLLKNALYYKNKPGFRIEISTDEKTTGNFVTVRDTGPGIPSKNIDRIFDSFYTSGKKEGVGLGLAFCKRVIDSFGGEITCRSKEHEWTEFVIRLPRYDSPESEQLKRQVLRTKDILIVDDSQTNRLIASKYLAEWNCRTAQAENGAQAIALLSKKKFDLVLMDVEMPVMKGDEATRRIRSGTLQSSFDSRDIPIIGVSALPEHEIHRRTIGAGMNRFLSKPISKDDLSDVFEQYFFAERKQTAFSTTKALEGTSILVVDDNLTSRKYLSAILERMGANVSQAENGQEAIACLEREDYDIVLLDMEMPVLNGVETAMKIREGSCFTRFRSFRDIPIIALTGNTEDNDIALTRESGMNAHLGKPVSREELLKTLSFWLAK